MDKIFYRSSGIFTLLCLGLLPGCAGLIYDIPEGTEKTITERPKSKTAYLLDPTIVKRLYNPTQSEVQSERDMTALSSTLFNGVITRDRQFSSTLRLKIRDQNTGDVREIRRPASLGPNTIELSDKSGPEWETSGKYLAVSPPIATFNVSCSIEGCVATPSGISVKDDGEILATQTVAVDAEQVKSIEKKRLEEAQAAKERELREKQEAKAAAELARNEAYINSHLDSVIAGQSRKVIDQYNKVFALQNKMSALRRCRYTAECQANSAKAVKLSNTLQNEVFSFSSESEQLKGYFGRYESSKGPQALRRLLVKEGVIDVCKVSDCGADVWIPQ